jgi:PAS domain S-box-containing protein
VDNIIVRRMLDVIERDYANVVTLRTLSSNVGRQPAYIGRLFRQEVGSTARDYLTHVRLEHAASLIRDGVKIEAVALSVGYRSKKNFYQQFRRHFGTTPLLFRTDSAGTESSSAEAPAETTDEAASVSGNGATAAPRTLAAIIRASNRAWRLAIRAQQVMVDHFHRFRIAMLLTDDEGRYVAANRTAMAVTGYSSAELHALPPSGLFVEPSAADVRCVWQLLTVRQTGPGHGPNATLRTKTGKAIAVHVVTLRNFLWGRRELARILDYATVPG